MNNPDNVGKDGKVDRVMVQQEYNDWNQAHFRKVRRNNHAFRMVMIR